MVEYAKEGSSRRVVFRSNAGDADNGVIHSLNVLQTVKRAKARASIMATEKGRQREKVKGTSTIRRSAIPCHPEEDIPMICVDFSITLHHRIMCLFWPMPSVPTV